MHSGSNLALGSCRQGAVIVGEARPDIAGILTLNSDPAADRAIQNITQVSTLSQLSLSRTK